MKHLLGEISLPGRDAMDQDWRKWVARLETNKDCHDEIKFQTDFVMELAKVTNIFYHLTSKYSSSGLWQGLPLQH